MRILFKALFFLALAILAVSAWMLTITRHELWTVPLIIGGAFTTLFGILIAKEK